MPHAMKSIAFAGVAIVLAGCESTPPDAPMPAATTTPPASTMRSGSAADEAACITAVKAQTNNPQAVIISSDFSQAATEIIVGVGAQKARWQCLVSGGKVTQVMSLTNEGTM